MKSIQEVTSCSVCKTMPLGTFNICIHCEEQSPAKAIIVGSANTFMIQKQTIPNANVNLSVVYEMLLRTQEPLYPFRRKTQIPHVPRNEISSNGTPGAPTILTSTKWSSELLWMQIEDGGGVYKVWKLCGSLQSGTSAGSSSFQMIGCLIIYQCDRCADGGGIGKHPYHLFEYMIPIVGVPPHQPAQNLQGAGSGNIFRNPESTRWMNSGT